MKKKCKHKWIFVEECDGWIDNRYKVDEPEYLFSGVKFYCENCRCVIIEELDSCIIRRRLIDKGLPELPPLELWGEPIGLKEQIENDKFRNAARELILKHFND